MTYYTGTKQECGALDAQITSNCGWPNHGTTHWDTPRQTTTGWAIVVPQGSHGFTKEQMTLGINAPEVEDVQFLEGI